MHPDFAPMLLGMTLFIVSGAVILLWPITRRFGAYLELRAQERRPEPIAEPVDTERIVTVLEALEQRIARLEERQEFTDALLGEGDTPRLSRR